ncbi:MAG: L,D-transpeptidase [Pseudobdellovibrionaceae bacterium]
MHVNSLISALILSAVSATAVAQTSSGSKYFIIQNIATERTRVYERCQTEGCASHKMILEARTVVGRPTGTDGDSERAKTWLGAYRIQSWVKFYQDGAKHYPSWYNSSSPMLPKPGASFLDWMSKSLLPNPGQGVYRGAFGWYAGLLQPNVNQQWLHGTYGWGADGNKFIDETRNFFLTIVKDARSSGCTRLSNENISYIRHLVKEGADVIRIYANEAWRDRSLSKYGPEVNQPGRWDYMLTTESVNKPGATIDKSAVLSRNLSSSQILEEGTLYFDRKPSARPYRKVIGGWTRRWNPSGNVYSVSSDDFKGLFLVDEGVLLNYAHPKGLKVSGNSLPSYIKTTNPTAERPGSHDTDTEDGE